MKDEMIKVHLALGIKYASSKRSRTLGIRSYQTDGWMKMSKGRAVRGKTERGCAAGGYMRQSNEHLDGLPGS